MIVEADLPGFPVWLSQRRAPGGCGAILLALALGVGLPSGLAAESPALFLKACAPCHGKDGRAGTPAARKLGVKDMTSSTLNETQIRQQIHDGRKGPDGTLKMPSFQESLKPAEIEALARYAKSLQLPQKPKPSAPR